MPLENECTAQHEAAAHDGISFPHCISEMFHTTGKGRGEEQMDSVMKAIETNGAETFSGR